MEHVRQVIPDGVLHEQARSLGRPPFGRPPPPCVAIGADRRAIGDPVQPRAHRVPHPERTAPTRQDEKRRLERVLGLILVVQDRPTGAQNHRAVPFEQGCECELGRRLVPRRELLQQLTIRQAGGRPRVEKPAKTLQTGPVAPSYHGIRLPGCVRCFLSQ